MPPGALPGLARHSRLEVLQVLAWLNVLAESHVVPLGMLAHSQAIADPDRAGAEHAPQLARAGQIGPVP